MGLFTKPIGQIFYKDSSDLQEHIKKLEELLIISSGDIKKKIEKHLAMARYGELGEKNIEFELKNSGIDMYILRDLYFQINDLSAQIDYLIITRKSVFVLECKNLIGNIEIDNNGNFTRIYEINNKKIKEGIYSPITQNERHLNVIKTMLLEKNQGIFARNYINNSFYNIYKSLVVLSNPKTCLFAKFARKEVKNKVIKADQLIQYIKEIENNSKEYSRNEKEMKELAEYFLKRHILDHSSYEKIYFKLLDDVKKVEEKRVMNRDELREELRKYRLNQSRKENIKPYFIYNDAQMNDLIEKNPSSLEELLSVSGFGEKKVQKYGNEILEILNKY